MGDAQPLPLGSSWSSERDRVHALSKCLLGWRRQSSFPPGALSLTGYQPLPWKWQNLMKESLGVWNQANQLCDPPGKLLLTAISSSAK